jgi:hypothetical protein
VVVVGSSRFGKVARARAVVGVVSTEREMSDGQGIAATAVVLGAFSWRKLQKLGRPGNREVVLSGGAPEWGTTTGISTALGGAEVRHEQKNKKKERRSSYGGALLLKPHEAVDDGGVAVGTMGGKEQR